LLAQTRLGVVGGDVEVVFHHLDEPQRGDVDGVCCAQGALPEATWPSGIRWEYELLVGFGQTKKGPASSLARNDQSRPMRGLKSQKPSYGVWQDQISALASLASS
jgi:hypothetical protein